MRDLLKDLIEVCDADAVVKKEFKLQTTKGPTKIVKSDLYVEQGSLLGYVIDVTIGNPAANNYLEKESWKNRV